MDLRHRVPCGAGETDTARVRPYDQGLHMLCGGFGSYPGIEAGGRGVGKGEGKDVKLGWAFRLGGVTGLSLCFREDCGFWCQMDEERSMGRPLGRAQA